MIVTEKLKKKGVLFISFAYLIPHEGGVKSLHYNQIMEDIIISSLSISNYDVMCSLLISDAPFLKYDKIVEVS